MIQNRLSFHPVMPRAAAPAAPVKQPTAGRQADQRQAASFQTLLQEQMLKVSHHAESRMKQRGIEFSSDDWSKLNQAVDQARAKGAKDSLVLMNGMALIVSIPNRTVVTAIDQAGMDKQVFTQIDSAVILN